MLSRGLCIRSLRGSKVVTELSRKCREKASGYRPWSVHAHLHASSGGEVCKWFPVGCWLLANSGGTPSVRHAIPIACRIFHRDVFDSLRRLLKNECLDVRLAVSQVEKFPECGSRVWTRRSLIDRAGAVTIVVAAHVNRSGHTPGNCGQSTVDRSGCAPWSRYLDWEAVQTEKWKWVKICRQPVERVPQIFLLTDAQFLRRSSRNLGRFSPVGDVTSAGKDACLLRPRHLRSVERDLPGKWWQSPQP